MRSFDILQNPSFYRFEHPTQANPSQKAPRPHTPGVRKLIVASETEILRSRRKSCDIDYFGGSNQKLKLSMGILLPYEKDFILKGINK